MCLDGPRDDHPSLLHLHPLYNMLEEVDPGILGGLLLQATLMGIKHGPGFELL